MIIFDKVFFNPNFEPTQLNNAGMDGFGVFARITTPFPISHGFFIFFWSLVYVFQILAVLIVYLTLKVFTFIQNDNLFSQQVVLSIRRLGLTTIILSCLQTLSQTGFNIYFNHFDKLKIGYIVYARFSPGVSGIFFGLIILVIAHVFLEATKIKEEQNLTI